MENLKAKSFDLRKDTVDIIVAGKGGHIGGDMSVIDTLMSLYFCQMNISPENMDDPNRDRFVLSKGHSVGCLFYLEWNFKNNSRDNERRIECRYIPD